VHEVVKIREPGIDSTSRDLEIRQEKKVIYEHQTIQQIDTATETRKGEMDRNHPQEVHH
jgi:hypothetical protein